MTTISARSIVNVTPSVIAAGGSALAMIGLILTTTPRIPIGTVLSFPTAPAVASYFGAGSLEATLAANYFSGFRNAEATPGQVLFAQYPLTPVAAFVRGGNISATPLATLQGYNGVLNVTIDGVLKTATINLSGATSFSNAAEIIAQGLGIQGVADGVVTASIGGQLTCTSSGTTLTVSAVISGSLQVGDVVTGTDGTNSLPVNTTIVAQLTGSPGSTGTYQMSQSATPGNLGSCTVTANSTVLKVTAITSGKVGVADVISGAGITAGTYVASQVSGTTNGVGLYAISTRQRVVSETVNAFTPAVTYDSVSGAFSILSGTTGGGSTITYPSGALATNLLLPQASGAVISQGAAGAVPGGFMDGIVAVTQNWAGFMTAFDPDGGSGNTQKLAFATWNDLQPNRYLFACWDTDTTPTTTVPATTSLGYLLALQSSSGTSPIYNTPQIAAFVLGAMAAIDFASPNGRITFAGKWQDGLLPTVTTDLAASNLIANGYNFGGAYGAASATYTWLQKGTVTGPFKWIDSYVNQIWLNNKFQGALLNLIGNSLSIPYDDSGTNLIDAACADTIAAGLSFGAYAPGTISSAQAAEVNAQAGTNISSILQTQGWYLQILPADAATRADRKSPPAKFWYLDRGSVQQINLSSIAVT